jgi:hypothetical protein
MRGKSARVGSGFVAESPRNPFPLFQLPTGSRLVWDKHNFSGTSRSSMVFNGRRHIGGLGHSQLQSNTAMQPPKAAWAVGVKLEPPNDALHMRLCYEIGNGNFFSLQASARVNIASYHWTVEANKGGVAISFRVVR